MSSNVESLNTPKTNIDAILHQLKQMNDENGLKGVVVMFFTKDDNAGWKGELSNFKGAGQYIPLGLLTQLTHDLSYCINPEDVGFDLI